MKYTREDYLSDCKNPDMIHIKDAHRFKCFYEELGNDPIQKSQQVVQSRINFINVQGSVIELGGHVGFNCIKWGVEGFECVGIDISSTLINEANRRLSLQPKEVQENVHFIQSDILDLNVGRKFDTVVLTETLEHVMDPLPIIKKALDFMGLKSKLYIAAPSVRTGTYSHVRGISEQYLTEVANQLGFNIEFIDDAAEGKVKNTQAIVTLR